jgi:tetratricopeptide (TPR) repeat protein
MGPTKRELDEISGPSDRLKRVIDFLVPLVRPLWRIGFLRRAASRSIGGRYGAIVRRVQRGEHETAVALAMETLRLDEYRHGRPHRFRPSDQDFWWTFMAAALHSLAQLDDPAKWDEAIALAKDGVEPFQGYEVAQCLLAFAQWKYRAGEYDAALEFAERATRADETWAEPDFFLGWYRLVLGGGDATPHLAEAVRKDRGILFRIARDPVCRRYPHLIQQLKEQVASDSVSGADVPDATDESGSS